MKANHYQDTASNAGSVAASENISISASQLRREEEKRRHEERVAEIKKGYKSILEPSSNSYHPKMVGLNPNMRPTTNQSIKKIFPMQGLWPEKNLLKSTRDQFTVPEKEQIEECKQTDKHYFKKMYKQKEYMEEYLKFKEVIAGMKK